MSCQKVGFTAYPHIDGCRQAACLDPGVDLKQLSPLVLCELGLGLLQQLQLLSVLL
jgi:hypothetical protein